jgi:hypothetical protein
LKCLPLEQLNYKFGTVFLPGGMGATR